MIRRYLVFLFLLLSGCSDGQVHSTEPSSVLRVSAGGGEQAIVNLARAIARAMDNPSMRLEVQQVLANSPYPENKVHFQDLINRSENALGVALHSQNSDLSSILERLPPIEMYLPLDSHRTSWLTSVNPIAPLVAVVVRDGGSERIRAFTTSGSEEFTDPQSAPDVPTIVINRAEIRFSHTASRVSLTSEPLMDTVSSGGGGDSCAGLPNPHFDGNARLVLRCVDVFDLHEPWYRGDPELEIHRFVNIADTLHHRGCLYEANGYDQNSTNWNGELVIRNTGGAEGVVATDSVVFMMWEEDAQGPCPNIPHTSIDFSDYLDVAVAFAVAGVLNFHDEITASPWIMVPFTIAMVAWEIRNNLDEDDFVGTLVHIESSDLPDQPGRNFSILDLNGNAVGHAKIVLSQGDGGWTVP